MSKAVISSKTFLVEGGCNACGLQSTETFTIQFDDHRSEILDSFDVSSLVQTIAQKSGWRETAIPVGISEEKIVLKKGLEIVSPKYLNDQVVYQRENQRIQTKQTFEDTAELFDTVNQILVQLFEIEPYEIERA